jgi:hypothetical protein
MSVAIDLSVRLESINCGECGGTYALNARYIQQKRDKSGTWNCPYCRCGWGFREAGLDKEISKLKEQLDSEKQRRAWAEAAKTRAQERADHEASRAAGYKGAFTKAKKRVGHGVCPCCNRSFPDLRRHMESKHPDYADAEPADPTTVEPEQPETSPVCGADTASGEPCQRTVMMDGWHCWQHRRQP